MAFVKAFEGVETQFFTLTQDSGAIRVGRAIAFNVACLRCRRDFIK